MYVLLKNIAKDIQDLTEITTSFFPFRKFMNDPGLILEPRGTNLHLRGRAPSAQDLMDAEHEFSFIIRLQSIGKGEETVEEFYRLLEICDKTFCKRIGAMKVFDKPSATIEFKKRVNSGTYGAVIDEGENENSPYIFEEIWDCTIKFRTYV